MTENKHGNGKRLRDNEVFTTSVIQRTELLFVFPTGPAKIYCRLPECITSGFIYYMYTYTGTSSVPPHGHRLFVDVIVTPITARGTRQFALHACV